MTVNNSYPHYLICNSQNNPKVTYVYYDHYKKTLREDFIKTLIMMKCENYGAVLRKKTFDSCSSKIVTAIFDDSTEARDEMIFEVGSLIENNSAINNANLTLSKNRAHIVMSDTKLLRLEYRIYPLNDKSVAWNKFNVVAS